MNLHTLHTHLEQNDKMRKKEALNVSIPRLLCFSKCPRKNKDKLMKMKLDIFKCLGKLKQNTNEGLQRASWSPTVSIHLNIGQTLKGGNCQQISESCSRLLVKPDKERGTIASNCLGRTLNQTPILHLIYRPLQFSQAQRTNSANPEKQEKHSYQIVFYVASRPSLDSWCWISPFLFSQTHTQLAPAVHCVNTNSDL